VTNRTVRNLQATWNGMRAIGTYLSRGEVCPQPPTTLWIEPTNRCNLRCVMCPTCQRTRSELGFMSLDVYRSLIDQVSSYVTTINLFVSGESLLHKDLAEMIRYASEHGIAVRLNTNATVLTEKRSLELLDSGLDHLIFSFDGYDAETYESVRVNAHFEPVLQNILRFLELKKERGAVRPYTILQTVVVRHQEQMKEEEREFRDRFRGLPMDAFIVREVHAWRGTFEEAKTQAGAAGSRYTACPYVWSTMTVLWDGTVVPCCLDVWADYVLGNCQEQPLLSIWNSEVMRTLQRRLLAKEYADIPLCHQCDLLWSNENLLGLPQALLKVSVSHPVENLIGYHRINQFKRLVKGQL
jgi:radical SAM protein with 4Fe4S-binding SPASM domain